MAVKLFKMINFTENERLIYDETTSQQLHKWSIADVLK